MNKSVALLLLLVGCGNGSQPAADTPAVAQAVQRFPRPDRPVAPIAGALWSDEATRDHAGESSTVFRLLHIGPGSRVADIGAGSGYYTQRLSEQVGRTGHVFANDLMPDHLERLRRRVLEQKLSNVSLVLGDPGDARLDPHSVDVALMAHMYHEIADPFSLLWHLHDSLRPGGRVAVVDADRSPARHGTPPDLLICEMSASGFELQERYQLPAGNYLAVFTPVARPAPETIRPCRWQGGRSLPKPILTTGRPEPVSPPGDH